MVNRVRKNKITFFIDDDELSAIKQKMKKVDICLLL